MESFFGFLFFICIVSLSPSAFSAHSWWYVCHQVLLYHHLPIIIPIIVSLILIPIPGPPPLKWNTKYKHKYKASLLCLVFPLCCVSYSCFLLRRFARRPSTLHFIHKAWVLFVWNFSICSNILQVVTIFLVFNFNFNSILKVPTN
jgi:hypothetical protein